MVPLGVAATECCGQSSEGSLEAQDEGPRNPAASPPATCIDGYYFPSRDFDATQR